MLFERARWPAKVRPEVAEAPCCGVRSVVTPGVMTENEMKLRPLIGRLSICCCETTVATAVRCASSSGPGAETVMVSAVPETLQDERQVDAGAEGERDALPELARKA